MVISRVRYTLLNSWLVEAAEISEFDLFNIDIGQVTMGGVKLPSYPMFSILLRRGFNEYQVVRKASNLLDLFSELGGLLAIIVPLLTILLSSYVKSEFQNQILGKLFKY